MVDWAGSTVGKLWWKSGHYIILEQLHMHPLKSAGTVLYVKSSAT